MHFMNELSPWSPRHLAVLLSWFPIGLAVGNTATFPIRDTICLAVWCAVGFTVCGRRSTFRRSSLSCPLVLEFRVTLPPSVEDSIPYREEGLGEVGLDAPALVVNIVVGRVVARDVLERVPGERVAAVVVDRLHRGANEEAHAHPLAHE